MNERLSICFMSETVEKKSELFATLFQFITLRSRFTDTFVSGRLEILPLPLLPNVHRERTRFPPDRGQGYIGWGFGSLGLWALATK
jgi:hypothetical protein